MDDKIKRFLDGDRFAKHVGIDLLDVSPGRSVARMTIRDHHRNGVGTVHGGAIVTLADLAFAAAANAAAAGGWGTGRGTCANCSG